jgi:hypothetical protein
VQFCISDSIIAVIIPDRYSELFSRTSPSSFYYHQEGGFGETGGVRKVSHPTPRGVRDLRINGEFAEADFEWKSNFQFLLSFLL